MSMFAPQGGFVPPTQGPAQGYGPPPAQGYGPPPAQGYGPPPAQGPAQNHAPPLGNIFAGFDPQQHARKRSNYPDKPGRYIMKILGTKSATNRTQIPIFIIEMKCIMTLECDPQQGGHRAGEEVGKVFSRKNESFLSNVAGFVQSMERLPSGEVHHHHLQRAVSENPYAGMIVELTVRSAISTKSGNPYTILDFRPLEMRELELLFQHLSEMDRNALFAPGEIEALAARRNEPLPAGAAPAPAPYAPQGGAPAPGWNPAPQGQPAPQSPPVQGSTPWGQPAQSPPAQSPPAQSPPAPQQHGMTWAQYQQQGPQQ